MDDGGDGAGDEFGSLVAAAEAAVKAEDAQKEVETKETTLTYTHLHSPTLTLDHLHSTFTLLITYTHP